MFLGYAELVPYGAHVHFFILLLAQANIASFRRFIQSQSLVSYIGIDLLLDIADVGILCMPIRR